MKMISTLFPSARKLSAFLQSYGLSTVICLLTLGFASSSLVAQSAVSGQVTLSPTLAALVGGGSTVPSTTASAATAVKLNSPSSVAMDAAGNLYIADAANNLIEQVSPAGQIVVIAGGGGTIPTAASEAATSAKLNNPAGVAVDATGNVYIADATNNLVEQVTPAGQIVAIAGGGGTVPSFTSEAAASAQLSNPTGVAVDTSGNVYIADQGNALVEEVTAGQIVAIAGGGIKTPSSAFSRDADTVEFINPSAVAVDGAGDVYIVDQGRSEIEELTAGQVTVMIGGGGTIPSYIAQAATNAQLNAPVGITLDTKGNLYIADQGNGLIEQVSGGQILVAVAGGGSTVPTAAGGVPSSAKFNSPAGTAVDAAGNVYIADRGNNLVEKLERSQAILPATAVGSTSPSQNIQIQLQAASAIGSIVTSKAANGTQEFTVGTVTGCSVGGAGNPAGTVCIVPITFSPAYPGLRTGALTVNNGSTVIGTAGLYGTGQGPELAQSPGELSVIAGGGTIAPSTTATAPLSTLVANPLGEAVDGAGNLYFVSGTNGNGTVDEVSATTGQITVVAGGGATVPTTTPEPATSASITPYGVAVDAAGNLYIGDYGNNQVEEVDATTGQIVAIAGNNNGNGASTTPQPALSAAIYPFGVAVDTTGNVYIVDRATQYGNGTIDEIPAGTGQIVIVAGLSYNAATPTPEPALSAGFADLTNVAVDGAGNYYIADAGNDRVEKVNVSTGLIATIAGFGPNLPSTTPTLATDASLNNPFSVAVDAAGNVYIAEGSNGFVDQVNPAGQIVRIAGGGTAAPVSTGSVATSVQLYNPTGIAIDGVGNLYIADSTNNLVEKISPSASPLAFSNTYIGATNAAQQTINLENIGNQTLNIASLSPTTDFPLVGTNPCSSLASGVSCSLVYGFLPTTAGVLNETATLTDNNLNGTSAQQTISLTGTGVAAIVPVNPGSYTMTGNPSAVTVKAGQAGTATLTLTPTGGYTGSVTLNCSNLPANTTCAFSQSGGSSNGTVMLSGNNQPVQVTLTIQTNAASQVAAATEQSPLNPILPALAFWWPGSIVGFAVFGRRRKKQGLMRNRQRLLQIGLLVLMTGAMAGLMTGCGGGSSSSASTTPAGTSLLTVTSTPPVGSTGISQSVSFTLIITQ